MIRFRATLALDKRTADIVLRSTALENIGYVGMKRTEKGLEISFEARDYGSFLHTFNDLFVSVLMVIKTIES
jgi:hypothetical protein